MRVMGGSECTQKPCPLLTDAAASHGARPAVKFDEDVITYEQLNEGAAKVAGLLKQRGVAPGDRVGMMLPNVPYFVMVYYGILRAGGVVVPMNVLLKGREVRFYLSDSQAKQLFVWHEFAESGQAGSAEAGAEVITVGARRVRPAPGRCAAGDRGCPARSIGRGRDHLHVRNDRYAQGS